MEPVEEEALPLLAPLPLLDEEEGGEEGPAKSASELIPSLSPLQQQLTRHEVMLKEMSRQMGDLQRRVQSLEIQHPPPFQGSLGEAATQETEGQKKSTKSDSRAPSLSDFSSEPSSSTTQAPAQPLLYSAEPSSSLLPSSSTRARTTRPRLSSPVESRPTRSTAPLHSWSEVPPEETKAAVTVVNPLTTGANPLAKVLSMLGPGYPEWTEEKSQAMAVYFFDSPRPMNRFEHDLIEAYMPIGEASWRLKREESVEIMRNLITGLWYVCRAGKMATHEESKLAMQQLAMRIVDEMKLVVATEMARRD